MQEIELTGPQRLALENALVPMAGTFQLIAAYGSRVAGTSRPGSDIDLVVYGVADDGAFYAIREAVEASDLSIFADILRYEDISHAPLKREIDLSAKPFIKGRLVAGGAGVSAA